MHIIFYNIFRSQMSAISASVQSSTTGTFRISQSLLTMAVFFLSLTVPAKALDTDKQYPQMDIENFLGVGVDYAAAARKCCGIYRQYWYPGEKVPSINEPDLMDQLNRIELNRIQSKFIESNRI